MKLKDEVGRFHDYAHRNRQGVLVDLDGTLFDTTHRDHLLTPLVGLRDQGETSEVEAILVEHGNACKDDTVVPGVLRLLTLLYPHYEVVLASSRPIATIEATRQTLAQWEVPYHRLMLRPDGITMRAADLKKHFIKRLESEGTDIVLVLDDYGKTVEEVDAEMGIQGIHLRSYTLHG